MGALNYRFSRQLGETRSNLNGLRGVRKFRIAAVLALGLLTACQTTKGGFCSIAQPIRLSAAQVDQLSDAEVKALLSHNRKGQALCSWKP